MKFKLTDDMNWLDVALAAVEICQERGEDDKASAIRLVMDWRENDLKGFARLEEEVLYKFLVKLMEDAHAYRRREIERGEDVEQDSGYKPQTTPRAQGASRSPAQKRLNVKRNRWLVWKINGCRLANMDGPAMMERAQKCRRSGAGELRTAIFLEKVARKVKNEAWFDQAYEEAKVESLEAAGVAVG
jgi:hypothetical protein